MGRRAKKALESAGDFLIGRASFFLLLCGLQSRSESTQADLTHPDVGEEASRLPW